MLKAEWMPVCTLCMCACMHVCMCACMHVCMYVQPIEEAADVRLHHPRHTFTPAPVKTVPIAAQDGGVGVGGPAVGGPAAGCVEQVHL